MESNKFTRQTVEAIGYAKKAAIDLGMNYIGTEHILAGISKVTNGVAANILYNYNLVYNDIISAIEEDMGIKAKVRSKSRAGIFSLQTEPMQLWEGPHRRPQNRDCHRLEQSTYCWQYWRIRTAKPTAFWQVLA